MKNDQYFPLEANMMNDERLAAVIERFGAKGIGIYLVLLIELRKHEGYRCGLNSLRMLARTYSLGIAVMDSVIYDFGLFELTEEGDSILISSPYMDRVMRALEEKRERSSRGGNARAGSAPRDSYGRFTSAPGAEEKSINTPTEENNPNRTTSDKIKPWKEYLGEALKNQSWMECQAKHSGLGLRFLQYQSVIADMFVDHVITHGKESTLFSESDVRYYFANFVCRGSVTNKVIRRELDELEQAQQKNNPYRFETVDPVTGERSYYGNIIPADAPPRPSEKMMWNYERRLWE